MILANVLFHIMILIQWLDLAKKLNTNYLDEDQKVILFPFMHSEDHNVCLVVYFPLPFTMVSKPWLVGAAGLLPLNTAMPNLPKTCYLLRALVDTDT